MSKSLVNASVTLTAAICVRNGGKTIAEAVKSLCEQRAGPERIIVIDDGSTDNTRIEVENIESEIPIEFIPNEGKWLFDGRNTALNNCGTDFLAFIDADCVADREWTKSILEVFRKHPEVAAGTGAHPQIGKPNWVSRMHRLWFIVEGNRGAGYAQGVVGANSYFRVSVLREIGGWMPLPLGNAEDFYISLKILEAGHKIWIDEKIKVYHHFTRGFGDLMMKSYKSGYAITYLILKAGFKGFWFYYTLAIPLVALSALAGLLLGIMGFHHGWWLLGAVLFGTFLFNLRMFRTVSLTLPRWAVRWVLIWGYSLGIIKAILKG